MVASQNLTGLPSIRTSSSLSSVPRWFCSAAAPPFTTRYQNKSVRRTVINKNTTFADCHYHKKRLFLRWPARLSPRCFISSSWPRSLGCWWRVCCCGAKWLQSTWARTDTWSTTISSAGVETASFFRTLFPHSASRRLTGLKRVQCKSLLPVRLSRTAGVDRHHHAVVRFGQVLSGWLLLAQCPERRHLGLRWTCDLHHHG